MGYLPQYLSNHIYLCYNSLSLLSLLCYTRYINKLHRREGVNNMPMLGGVLTPHPLVLLPDLDGMDTVEQQLDIARQKGGIHAGEPYKIEWLKVVRHL